MRLQRVIGLAGLAVAAFVLAAPASAADATAFLGVAGGPSTRLAKGLAVGAGVGPIGWEAEYSSTGSDLASLSPSLWSGMVNLMLQTPETVRGLQIYGTGGAGLYHENLGGPTETSLGVNVGGGVKMALAGPLRLRADYRVFHLSGSPFGDRNVSRFYVAANVKF